MMEETSMKVLILGRRGRRYQNGSEMETHGSFGPGDGAHSGQRNFLRRVRLPYYVGGLIEERDELIVNTPAQ